ncbi:RNA polymerase sigma factor [Mucilaginibacter sp.]|uniref:RNA polymerase sigma factor n=1 Tax=Mucilaginibacter sp. TaxID=1882438 RepID=UPI003D14DEB8
MVLYGKYDDAEILELLVKGEEQAFTEIYNRYWKKLIGLAYSHTKDKFLAEEIVQEVFLSLWNRKNSICIGSLGAYLATAVKFSIFKHIHKRNRQTQIIEGIAKHSALDMPDDIFHAKFLQEYVGGIVEQLPEKCRIVYKLSREKDMSIKEIAKEMDIAEKTVEAHLTKALKTLRLNLKELFILVCILKQL